MRVKCLKFDTYYSSQDAITECINSAIEDKEVIDIRVTSSGKGNSIEEDEMLLFVTILYK